jgi:hypothetical protein
MRVLISVTANKADIKHAVVNLSHGKGEQIRVESGHRDAQVRDEMLQWHIAARFNAMAKMPEGVAEREAHPQVHCKTAKVAQSFRVVGHVCWPAKVKMIGREHRVCHADVRVVQSIDAGKNLLDMGPGVSSLRTARGRL